jgi:hypothetical protein
MKKKKKCSMGVMHHASASIVAAPKKGKKKIKKVMGEFKSGKLHSGKSGKVVKNPKKAIDIALSEADRAKKKK